MKFADVLEAESTVPIGIDVCHSGRGPGVGFAADYLCSLVVIEFEELR